MSLLLNDILISNEKEKLNGPVGLTEEKKYK